MKTKVQMHITFTLAVEVCRWKNHVPHLLGLFLIYPFGSRHAFDLIGELDTLAYKSYKVLLTQCCVK